MRIYENNRAKRIEKTKNAEELVFFGNGGGECIKKCGNKDFIIIQI